MDLIYTDKAMHDVGVLKSFSLDYESGTKDNSFEIKTALSNKVLDFGCYWYVDGEEYGGRADAIKIDTASNTIFYSGRTWRGILASKIIVPPAGADYYTASGQIHTIIRNVINDFGLSAMFEVATDSLKSISYKFERYTDVLTGIEKMLASNGYKLTCKWENGKVKLTAKEIVDWNSVKEISSDTFDFVMKKDTASVNHMIGLGSGELKDRLVVHRYIDANGEVSTTQHYFGLDEIVEIYDYPNAESLEELITSTEDKLRELSAEDSLDISVENIEADIGDKFTATFIDGEITVEQYVTSKITNLSDTSKTTQYVVGYSMY